MTDEQRQYGVAWLKCTRCGLRHPRVKGDPATCPTQAHCEQTICRSGFGGAPIPIGPQVRFELDDHDRDAIKAAVDAWHSQPLDGVAGGIELPAEEDQ